MHDPRFDAPASRLDRLERESRLLKRLLALTFVIAFALCFVGAVPDPKSKEVEANKFILRSEDSKIRASLALGKDGLPRLTFFDEEEIMRIEIGIDSENGPGISIEEADHQGGIGMRVNPKGGVSSIDIGQIGGYQALLSVAHIPEPSAELILGPSGHDPIRIASRPASSGMAYKDGSDRITWLGFDDDGTSKLIFMDKKEKERLILGRKADDSVFIKLEDQDGKVLSEIGARNEPR